MGPYAVSQPAGPPGQGRYLGLGVHKYWTQAAWHPNGSVQRERLATDPVLLRQLAARLGPEQVVAQESTTNASAIARLLKEKAGTARLSNPLPRPPAQALLQPEDPIAVSTPADSAPSACLQETGAGSAFSSPQSHAP